MVARGWLVLAAIGGLLALTAASFPFWSLTTYQAFAVPVDLDPETVDPIQYDELDPASQDVVAAAIEDDGGTTVHGNWGADTRAEAGIAPIIAEHRLGDDTFGALVEYRGELYDIESPKVNGSEAPPTAVVGGGVALGFLLFGAAMEYRRNTYSPFVLIGLGYLGVAAILWILSAGSVVDYV